jgi:DNA-binding transcriptional ArsR family regulator
VPFHDDCTVTTNAFHQPGAREVLRIRFSTDDFLRTRLATGPDPLWELTLSLPVVQAPAPWGIHQDWWTRSHRRLRTSEDDAKLVRQLAKLVPLRGDFPDFLTPSQADQGLDAGLEAVASMPDDRVRADVSRLRPGAVRPSWLRSLVQGDRDVRAWLVTTLRWYFAEFVRPAWDVVSTLVTAERDRCVRHTLTGGTELLLMRLSSGIRWNPPFLEADYPVDRTIDLGGRGITLIPSFFCAVTPVALIDPELPPVLAYPARPAPGRWTARPVPTPDLAALAAVVGHTRAGILYALTTPGTTTQLAERIGMSVASASHHAALLRNAGLLSSTRTGQTVTHALTRTGRSLLVAPHSN